MDYHQELENRKHRASMVIGELSYEHARLSVEIRERERRMRELEQSISAQEMVIQSTEQAQRDFNTYLAVKEGAVTLDQIQRGVEQAAQEERNEEE